MRARPSTDARHAAARLCLVDFSGPGLDAALERRIADDQVAGVVLFAKNVTSAAQVAALTTSLRAIRRETPLWIAIDHEGGLVTRFPPAPAARGPAMTALPSAMALGATRDPALAREAGVVAGRELRALGISLNFAPVLDVNNNPANPVIGTRAFGEDPALVATLGVAYIDGLQASGVAATAKHFPGHGDVTVDSHLALPRVEHGRARLDAVELAPFAAAARAGVAGIMTAHIVFPALDPTGAAATMSGPILTGLLREHLGFRGFVISDSLQMRAIANHMGVGDAAVAAVRAGCDAVLALGPEELQRDVLDRLAVAIERGEITAQRVTAATARLAAAMVRRAAAALKAAAAETPVPIEEVVGATRHQAVARRIADAAVTLVRDEHHVLPLRGSRLGVAPVEADATPAGDLVAALQRHGAAARALSPDDDLASVDQIVAVTCSRGHLTPAHAAVVRVLHRRAADRLVVVATGDPYDLLQLPEVAAYVATYGADPHTLDAAARVLLGAREPAGRLPVSLPGLGAAGTRAPGAAP